MPDKTGDLQAYLETLGVPRLPARTSPFDPGYDAGTVTSHLAQSAHLMSTLKISMATWIIADEASTRSKVDAARSLDVPVVTGGGPFEIAASKGCLDSYLDLCAGLGVSRVECGEGFTVLTESPNEIAKRAQQRGLEVQFELGRKDAGAISADAVQGLLDQGDEWLQAGAVALVIEARESAAGVGLFDKNGVFNATFADRFAHHFGLDTVVFEAPTKASQFALLDHFGPLVHLANVRLEELLRVEIYRRGLHADSFHKQSLRWGPPA